MLDFRLKAFAKWKTMKEPEWPNVHYPRIDFQNISYYSAPKQKKVLDSLDEVDPEVMRTFEKLGIPLDEQKKLANVAVDAVFDSVSVATTHKKKLMEVGIIFCSFSEALQEYPELIEEYLGTVVPVGDNYYAALNSAVFTDGSFVYIPPDTISPMEISTYFRINTEETGQFERTLIICAENSYVSYLEGCTAPQFDTNQLHAAVVELITLENAEIKYSTVQNWYAGDKETGKGGIYNFVTKRGVALTNGYMQADTGTKMIHVGKNTRSSIISKGISADHSSNSYRGQVKVGKNATNARNYSQCDSMLVGDKSSAHTFPYIETANSSVQVEHEAATSKISEEQLFYFESRGISRENAIEAVISGFCKEVFKQLPMEFAVEAQKLLTLKLEDSVG
jgi:Fe-S cluster assembly protein SufB